MFLNKGRKIVSKEQIDKHRQVLAQKVADTYTDVVLVCILKGAAYFTVDISRDLEELNLAHTLFFLDASSYDGIKQDKDVDIVVNALDKLNGKHVLLLDELYDNGKTMHSVKAYIAEHASCESLKTCVMFRKLSNKPSIYEAPDFVGMAVPDVWLVGYGLDRNGYNRGLPDIWAIPKPAGAVWTADDWKLFINKETLE